MLRRVPVEIMEIVLEYAVHFENGISVKWNPFLFQNANIGLIDKFFGSKPGIRQYELYEYDEEAERILQIICDYLPIYNYNDCPPVQYKIHGLCATEGIRLYEVLDDFVKAL